jgi:hypothetical protein
MKEAIILLSNNKESDYNLKILLEYYGLSVLTATTLDEIIASVDKGIKHVFADIEMFYALERIGEKLFSKILFLFLYKTSQSQNIHASLIQISKNRQDICGVLSGLSFTCPCDLITDNMPINKMELLITSNGRPLLGMSEINKCKIFLLQNCIMSIEQIIPDKFTNHFSNIVPIVMFIKYAFKNNEEINIPHYASLIIDDPLLRNPYGYVNYYELLKSMDKYNFFTNIAFIPWNYKTTDKDIADLFIHRSDRYSLCIHGCDHVDREFGISNKRLLTDKYKLAAARMIEHKKRSGVNYDQVMVFPQGVFSIAAMETIKKNGYLAAVNSVFNPIDAETDLSVKDYLGPCITKYGGFPLFIRRIPGSLVDFAVGLFLGKPAFIVIHNDDLKNGYDNLIDFVSKLNTHCPNLIWASVGNIIKNIMGETHYVEDLSSIDLSGKEIYDIRERAAIYLNRSLSVYRDNHLSKNESLYRRAKSLKGIFKKSEN